MRIVATGLFTLLCYRVNDAVDVMRFSTNSHNLMHKLVGVGCPWAVRTSSLQYCDVIQPKPVNEIILFRRHLLENMPKSGAEGLVWRERKRTKKKRAKNVKE